MKRLLSVGFIFVFVTLLGVFVSSDFDVAAQTTSSPGSTIWTATYYPSTDFTGTPVTTSYTGLNQTFSGSPISGIPEDNWSAVYTANIVLDVGTYVFTLRSDDTARLSITGGTTTVIGDLNPTGLTTITEQYTVVSGGTAILTVELIEITNDAVISLDWYLVGGGATAVPGATAGPTLTPIPPLTGSVEGVQGLSVRTGPFLGASRVAIARPGTEYPILGRNYQEGLFTWYLIQFDEDTVGWASGRYLELTGDENRVPEIGSTDFDRQDDPRGTVMATTRSTMNLRIFPTPRVPRVGLNPQIPWGGQVEILARTVQGGQDFWYQVRYVDEEGNAYIGWILAAYVGINRNTDPIDSVPIR